MFTSVMYETAYKEWDQDTRVTKYDILWHADALDVLGRHPSMVAKHSSIPLSQKPT